MKDTFYFSHDSNANQDPKILAMRSVYGWEGYGWYWMFIEMLRDQEDYHLNIEGKYAFNAFALQMHCDEEKTQQFINDCINEFKLFESDGKTFWSNSLLRRMEKAEERSKKARKSAESRWNKKANANAMQTHSECIAINENKVNENKVKTTTPISPPQDMPKPEDDFDPVEIESRRREVFESFEKGFGRPMNPIESEKVLYWLENFTPELILKALEIAVLGNNRSCKYIGGILGNWSDKGVKCVEDVDELERKHKALKDKNRASPVNPKCETTNNEYEIYMPPA